MSYFFTLLNDQFFWTIKAKKFQHFGCVPVAASRDDSHSQWIKVFWFFFSKKNCFLSYAA